MQKQYNPLLDAPPETAEVNGRTYQIATDYRIALAYIRLQESDDMTDQEKAVMALSMFYGPKVQIEDMEALAEHLRWYLRKGKEDEAQESSRADPVFDIQVDAGRIFAAFVQIYRINLRKVRMHWWIFLELLDALPQGTHLADVIEIRQRPFRQGMSAAERNSLARMKDHFRIGNNRSPAEGLFASLLEAAR